MPKPYVIVSAPVPASLMATIEQKYTVLKVPFGKCPSQVLSPKQLAQVQGTINTVATRLNGKVMDLMPALKVISNFAVGFDNIDINAATQRNILVCNTPEVLDGAVADLTFGLIICLSRDLIRGDAYVRTGQWEQQGPPPLTSDIRGKTLGLLGMGRIGSMVAKTARAFDMQVIYHNRSRNYEAEEAGLAQYRNRDDLFTQSDFVSIHVPLNASTKGSVGAREFALMQPTAYLINTGRGAVINENDLVNALQTGVIAGAGLDVMVEEPLPASHPFCQLPNIILQAHIGSATVETRHAMISLATQNLLDALQGTKPQAMVNPEVF